MKINSFVDDRGSYSAFRDSPQESRRFLHDSASLEV